MDIKSIVEQRILSIWEEFSDLELCKIPPLSLEVIDETGIVFIGINPSLSEEDRQGFLISENKEMGFYTLNTEGGGITSISISLLTYQNKLIYHGVISICCTCAKQIRIRLTIY